MIASFFVKLQKVKLILLNGTHEIQLTDKKYLDKNKERNNNNFFSELNIIFLLTLILL